MTVKGIIHVHSAYSYDGKESLQSLRSLLLERGISFCCLTEHTDFMTLEQAQLFIQECKALTTSQFVFIPGFEVPYKNTHILLLETEVFLTQKADIETLKQWSEKSSLTILAHPVRNAFIVDDELVSVLDGVEIWNAQYEGAIVPRKRSVALLRKLQMVHSNLLATGGLDFHRVEHLGFPQYTLELDMLSRNSIMQALKSGEYVFGREGVTVSSLGRWQGSGSILQSAQSFYSIFIITLGKKTNTVMKLFGLKFPHWLIRLVRSRV